MEPTLQQASTCLPAARRGLLIAVPKITPLHKHYVVLLAICICQQATVVHYAGDRCEAGQFHGRGKAVFSSGPEYDGDWQQGHMDGFGRLSFPDGVQYDGSIIFDRITGKGVSGAACQMTWVPSAPSARVFCPGNRCCAKTSGREAPNILANYHAKCCVHACTGIQLGQCRL